MSDDVKGFVYNPILGLLGKKRHIVTLVVMSMWDHTKTYSVDEIVELSNGEISNYSVYYAFRELAEKGVLVEVSKNKYRIKTEDQDVMRFIYDLKRLYLSSSILVYHLGFKEVNKDEDRTESGSKDE